MNMFGGIPAFGAGVTSGSIERSGTLTSHEGRQDFDSETFFVQDRSVNALTTNGVGTCGADDNAEGFDGSEDGTGRGQPIVTAYSTKLHHTSACGAGKLYEEYTASLDACSPPPALLIPSQVRRLIPRECERLQGMPDDYTSIPWRGKPASECPDGPRYKAIGNSKAVTVVRWIGMRIRLQIAD